MVERNERLLREERVQIRFENNQLNDIFEDWTDWQLIMGPNQTADLTEERDEIGFYHGDLEYFVDRCSIYELAFGHRVDHLTVVYAGSTCRERQGRVLERLREYCRNGNHKADLIDEILDDGLHIYFRARYVRPGVRNKSQRAEDEENDLLNRYDYAWNSRNNGAIRRI